jgi:ADP-heptose:LPS heptosyltransferase
MRLGIESWAWRFAAKISLLADFLTGPGSLVLLAHSRAKAGAYTRENINRILLIDPYAIGDFILTSDTDEKFAANFLSLGTHNSRPLIALGIGSARPKKEWPIENFVELAEWIVTTYGANILLVRRRARSQRKQ